ncbi:MAG: PAS domain-containing sensor histidine kinase, partial [Magnetospirillum sp.]|nr:PAS domain-containing sensor histidine kinase [Magnetospirillum sp.]
MLMLVVVVGICGLVVRYLHPIQVFATPGEYLALHSLLELVSIAVSLMVFSLGWALRKAERSGRGLILGIASASVGLIDFLHMFSYAGMPDLVTPSSSEKAINFWLLGRLVMAVALLV